MNCCDSRRVFRRMRQALEEFRDSQDAGDEGPGTAGGYVRKGHAAETQDERAVALERENRELRETVEAQAEELDALRWRVAELEERARFAGEDVAGLATLEEQPDEEQAFGPEAPLVAGWREIRVRMGDGSAGSRVAVRWTGRGRGGGAPVRPGGGEVAGLPLDATAGDGAFGSDEEVGPYPSAGVSAGRGPAGFEPGQTGEVAVAGGDAGPVGK